jgi:hypothetical protein
LLSDRRIRIQSRIRIQEAQKHVDPDSDPQHWRKLRQVKREREKRVKKENKKKEREKRARKRMGNERKTRVRRGCALCRQ